MCTVVSTPASKGRWASAADSKFRGMREIESRIAEKTSTPSCMHGTLMRMLNTSVWPLSVAATNGLRPRADWQFGVVPGSSKIVVQRLSAASAANKSQALLMRTAAPYRCVRHVMHSIPQELGSLTLQEGWDAIQISVSAGNEEVFRQRFHLLMTWEWSWVNNNTTMMHFKRQVYQRLRQKGSSLTASKDYLMIEQSKRPESLRKSGYHLHSTGCSFRHGAVSFATQKVYRLNNLASSRSQLVWRLTFGI